MHGLCFAALVAAAISGTSALWSNGTNASHHSIRHIRPFYIPHGESHFYRMARRYVTDKVSLHQYEMLYTKYFEANGPTQRLQPYKLLEIGLGCGMEYGAGHSARLWREYFPNGVLWFAEVNEECVNAHRADMEALNINVVTGSQHDPNVLRRWIQESGGNFDIIIDDGGHSNMQMFTSLTVLMEEALKPGGIYFVEDLHVARAMEWVDGDKKHVMIEVIKDWIEGVVMSWSLPNSTTGIPNGAAGLEKHLHLMQEQGAVAYLPTFTLPTRIQDIDCSAEMCAFVKCLSDDMRCPYGLPKGPAVGEERTECGRYSKTENTTMAS